MSNSNRKIVLIGEGRYVEAKAASVVTPGHLIQQLSSGTIQKHSTAGGYAETYFAQEDPLQGHTIDAEYASNATVMGYIANRGDEVNAFIKAGQNIVIGDLLISGGDGTLIKNGTQASGVAVKQIVGVAQEAVNLTASAAVATRISVRIL